MPEVTHHSKDVLESGFKLGSAGPWRLKWLLTEADGEGGQEGLALWGLPRSPSTRRISILGGC